MLRNYFFSALRNVLKNKLFTFINIFGLAVAITACLFIFKFVQYELSFDSFHQNEKNIYRVTSLWNKGKELEDKRAVTVPWTGPGAQELFPEIKTYGRFAPINTFIGKKMMTYEDKKIYADQIFFADPGFINMFSFKIIAGDKRTALTRPNTMVLTESIVKKHFGNSADIIGKIVSINSGDQLPSEKFEVTAVIEDAPLNSHIQFDVLVSFTSIFKGLDNGSTYWHWDYTYNYLLLDENADPVALGQKMSSERKRLFAKDMGTLYADQIEFILQPLNEVHLDTSHTHELSKSTNKKLLNFLIIIGIFIISIGYINYVNLALAKSLERLKEIGLRKSLGASRKQLIVQFILEALLINICAICFSILFYISAVPVFENLFEHSLTIDKQSLPTIISFLLLLLVSGTILAGLYPAFVLSSYEPIAALKNRVVKKMSVLDMRKILVVVQFSSAIILIGSAIIFFKQFHFMRDHKVGANLDDVLVIEGFGNYSFSNYQTVKSELSQYASIKKVSSASLMPGDELGNIKARLLKKNGQPTIDMPIVLVDENYFNTLAIPFLKGRTFQSSSDADRTSVILNEAAAKELGYTNLDLLAGELVSWELGGWEQGGKQTSVIGIVSNYYQQSLKAGIMPIIYLPRHLFNPTWAKQYFIVKSTAENKKQLLSDVQNVWDKVFEKEPFEYFFLKDHYDRLYQQEKLFGNAFGIFTIIAIVIASLGLIGLSTFTIVKRSKELAIRKVFYANHKHIISLLLMYYLKLIAVSYLIAMPLCYFFISDWLDNYPSRIDLGVSFFVLPALGICMVAILSIAYQTLKAAFTPALISLRGD